MKDLNRIFLIGRLGGDPVQRETKNGTAVASFSLATSRRLRESAREPGQATSEYPPEETQWHRVVSWGKQAEFCALYLKKGDKVFVEGTVKSHRYEAKDGTEKTAVDVHVEEISFLSSPRNRREQEQGSEEAVEF